ncbi:MAG: 30S ribosomal protein S16 [Candidatus Tectimicrobiota bacterium]
MSVKIRLKRMGTKKNPKYRVVVADARSPRDGRLIESLGTYDPIPTPPVINIDESRALYWLGQGAQPTDKVASLLRSLGLLKRFREAAAASTTE